MWFSHILLSTLVEAWLLLKGNHFFTTLRCQAPNFMSTSVRDIHKPLQLESHLSRRRVQPLLIQFRNKWNRQFLQNPPVDFSFANTDLTLLVLIIISQHSTPRTSWLQSLQLDPTLPFQCLQFVLPSHKCHHESFPEPSLLEDSALLVQCLQFFLVQLGRARSDDLCRQNGVLVIA